MSTVCVTLTCRSTDRCLVTWLCGSTKPWSNTWKRCCSPWSVSQSVRPSVCQYGHLFVSLSVFHLSVCLCLGLCNICLNVWVVFFPDNLKSSNLKMIKSYWYKKKYGEDEEKNLIHFPPVWLQQSFICLFSVVPAILDHEAIAGLTASKPVGMRGRSSSSANPDEEVRELSLDSLMKAVSTAVKPV